MKNEKKPEDSFKYRKLAQEYAIRAKELIDSGKFKELILGVDPDDPWSAESLKAAEEGFLSQYYANPDADYSHYMLFVGEGICCKYNAIWASGDVFGELTPPGSESLIGIYYPEYKDSYFTVMSNLLKHTVDSDKYDHAVWWSAIYEGDEELLARKEKIKK